MNKLIFTAAILLVISVTSVFAQSKKETEVKDQGALKEVQVIKVRVDGLSCPFCAYGLEKKFKKYEGVTNLKIDIEKGLVTFAMAKGKTIDERAIRKIVKDAGFTPKEIIFPPEKADR